MNIELIYISLEILIYWTYEFMYVYDFFFATIDFYEAVNYYTWYHSDMHLSTVTLMLNIDADVYTFLKRSVYRTTYYINALLLEWFGNPSFEIVEYFAISIFIQILK